MKIVIDAGHGYNTPGKRCPDGSMREWEFNHIVAAYVVDELSKFVGVETLITHDPTPNVDVPLKERTDKANAWGADVFVSIHANALGNTWGNAKGIETYVYTTRPVDSVKLANQVQAELIAATGLYNRGVKAEDFHVLRETHMTSILVECGFMDNQSEAELLKSDAYRRKIAGSIVNGLALVYGLKRKPTPAPTPKAPEGSKMEQWKLDMAYEAIDGLAKKGVIKDPEDWKKKVANGEAVKDLTWLIFYLANSAAELPRK